jgi:purine-nucleoside phosphorylase
MKYLRAKMEFTANYLRERIPGNLQVGIILGTGLGNVTEGISNQTMIPYEDIPYFPRSTVTGHAGRLVCGQLGGKNVVSLQGRFHYYEGYTMEELTFPVRVMSILGVNTIIVTNAAGGLNSSFSPGDLMIIEDHINLMGDNPLIGPNDPALGPRFPAMGNAYCRELRDLAREKARIAGIDVKEGVYVGVSGPNFETPAELVFLARIGAHAVGMSTVPEVIVANHSGIRVLGISCITNMAIGHQHHDPKHGSVLDTAKRASEPLYSLIEAILREV